MDSGNLAGSLLTLQAGLLELKDQPVLPANMFLGLQDTLQILAEHVPALPTPDLAQKIKVLQKTLDILARSEEHTSELQSHSFISYAVFCLKKKKKTKK